VIWYALTERDGRRMFSAAYLASENRFEVVEEKRLTMPS
jgi:hypothetical protein